MFRREAADVRLVVIARLNDRKAPALGQRAKEAAIKAAKELGIDGIFPEDGKYTSGSICSDSDVRQYYSGVWKSEIGNIKALIVIGGNFMEERGFQDTLRLLPADVPAFPSPQIA